MHGLRRSVFRFDFLLLAEIAAHERLQQFVAIQLADQRAGVVVVGDIGGILREDVADDLIDGVIPLFLQCLIDCGQNVINLHILIVHNTEFAGLVIHTDTTFPSKL